MPCSAPVARTPVANPPALRRPGACAQISLFERCQSNHIPVIYRHQIEDQSRSPFPFQDAADPSSVLVAATRNGVNTPAERGPLRWSGIPRGLRFLAGPSFPSFLVEIFWNKSQQQVNFCPNFDHFAQKKVKIKVESENRFGW
jgi:hypothetical protein